METRLEVFENQLSALVERVNVMEEEISTALNTLSEGVASNIRLMWDNQRELATALGELDSAVPDGTEEDNDEKRAGSRA